MKIKTEYIINEIIDQYLYADESNRPWVIGFSGGKDSTVLLQLVWEALSRIKDLTFSREIYVVSNDTLVENPVISEYVKGILKKIEKAALTQGLPIKVKQTIPRIEDSFWINLLGKGYPIPNNVFRWCTDKLKIKPTSRFVSEQISRYGEVIILLGTRYNESKSRSKSMKKFSKNGNRLSKHASLFGAYTYAPIRDLNLEEVWYILNTFESPWGADNSKLFEIYANASADDYECPTMVTNKKHQSCGQSRFGCWVCTVVQQDKSMTSQIENGAQWLEPLLKYRNELVDGRNKVENRMDTRRNGQPAVNGLGTYKPEYRAVLLEKLLKTQLEIQQTIPGIELITIQELIAIQVIWYRDLIFDPKVSEIYNSIYKKELDMRDHSERLKKEEELLKKACEGDKDDFDLIQELLVLQKSKSLLNRKRGIYDDMEKRIEKYLNKQADKNAD